jgi:hypothetical protein
LLPSSLFLLQRKGQMYMSAIRNLIWRFFEWTVVTQH